MSAIGTPLTERTASGASQKLGTVCGACNNGWMSRLEGAFANLLPRLRLDMSPRRFSKAERRTIALWIVKTGIIVHCRSNYQTILPVSVPRTLSQGATLPAGIKVFGGMSKPEKTIRWSESNIGLALIQRSDVAEFETGQSTFVFALSIMNIFSGFGWYGLSQDDFEIVYSGDALQRIYPHPEPAKRLAIFEHVMLATTEVGLRRRRA